MRAWLVLVLASEGSGTECASAVCLDCDVATR